MISKDKHVSSVLLEGVKAGDTLAEGPLQLERVAREERLHHRQAQPPAQNGLVAVRLPVGAKDAADSGHLDMAERCFFPACIHADIGRMVDRLSRWVAGGIHFR